jgi:predicted NBD/HSP70 family sugar kinase
VPLPEDLTRPGTGGFRSLADARSVRTLAGQYGFTPTAGGRAPGERAPGERAPGERAAAVGPAGESVAAAVAAAQAGEPGADAFLADLASRVAVGVASIVVTLDPELVVLGGEVGQAGGNALASRVSAEVSRISPVTPDVVPTAVPDAPVLRGALLAAVSQARADLLASVADG